MNSPSLEHIDLSRNQFEGPLPQWSSAAAAYLDLGSNNFSGPIPSNYDQLMPDLLELYLSGNHINGSIPPSLCNMSGLLNLMLRNNLLSGEFARAWSLWPAIRVVDVSYNNLAGKIPSSMGVPSSLNVLNLRKNNFTGQIPSSLFQSCTELQIIDLGVNRLTGSIPLWTSSFVSSHLYMLRSRSNSLSGQIPRRLCSVPSLHIIDLSRNNFSGTIPQCLYNLTDLAYGYDSAKSFLSSYQEMVSLTLKGQDLEYDTTLDFVNSIDFSSKNLEGVIPEGIRSLINLGTLNFSRNQLTGIIP
ncbi:hypothetical protein ACLB2K_026773 [Fragaria x ananassa]